MPIPALVRFEAAAKLLRNVIVPTPLVALRPETRQREIWLKPEIHQAIGSFKIRGVLHAVARLPESLRAQGLETVSAGNTAQALAWVGRHFGVSARCVMPVGAPQTKIDAVQGLGGEVHLMPRPELFRYMREHGWEAGQRAFVHPWTEPELWVGHGTLALEIHQQLEGLQSLFVPLGGGGLVAGVAAAMKALSPAVRIIAVEPEGCAAFHAARKAGRPVEVACETFCDGVAVPYITEEMFPMLDELVDEVQLVSEDQVRRALRALAFGNAILAEGAGALALAAAQARSFEERGRSVCLVTGGSIDPKLLVSILAQEQG